MKKASCVSSKGEHTSPRITLGNFKELAPHSAAHFLKPSISRASPNTIPLLCEGVNYLQDARIDAYTADSACGWRYHPPPIALLILLQSHCILKGNGCSVLFCNTPLLTDNPVILSTHNTCKLKINTIVVTFDHPGIRPRRRQLCQLLPCFFLRYVPPMLLLFRHSHQHCQDKSNKQINCAVRIHWLLGQHRTSYKCQ